MAAPVYKNLVFPQTVGGPGPYDTVVLTITGATVTPLADVVAYNVGDSTVKGYHDAFSDIVMFFERYGEPVSVAGTSSTITLQFERRGMFVDSALGKAPFFYSSAARANAFEIGAAYVASNSYSVSGIAVTVNGVSQTS